MSTRRTPDDHLSNVAPADQRARGTELARFARRPPRSSGAPVRSVLVALAALSALAGGAVTAQPAGASLKQSATLVAGPLAAFSRSTGPTLPRGVSASTVGAIVKSPCNLLTKSEADAAAGVRFAKEFNLKASGLCEYVANPSNNSTINVYVQMGTVAEDMPPKFANHFISEPQLGSGVVWVVEKGSPKGSGELWFPLGKVRSESFSVQVQLARGGLIEASTIARDCFSHM